MKYKKQKMKIKTITVLLILLLSIFMYTNISQVKGEEKFTQTEVYVPSVIHNSTIVTFTIVPRFDNGTNANVPVEILINETSTGEESPFGYGFFINPENGQQIAANNTILIMPNQDNEAKVDYIAPTVQEDISLNCYITINSTSTITKQITISPNIATDVSRSTITPSTTITASGGIVEILAKAETSQNGQLPAVQLILETNAGYFELNGAQDTKVTILLQQPNYEATIQWIAPSVTSEKTIRINATFITFDFYKHTDYTEIKVLPPDFTSSTLELNTTITKPNEYVKATVTVLNGQTSVGGIRVDFITNGGEFLGNNTIYSNNNGNAEIIWKAPLVTKTTTFWINATIFGSNGQIVQLSKTVITAATTYNITVFTNTTTIIQGETIEISVYLSLDEIPAPNVPVIISTQQGQFINGEQLVTGLTDQSGTYKTYWIADFQPLPVSGSDVLFVIQVDDGILAPVTKEFTIHVNPSPQQFTIKTIVSPTTIFVNQTTKITIQVLNDTEPVYNATVRIETGTGAFKEGLDDNPQVAYGITNQSGYVTFTWEPKGLLNPPEPRTVTFEIQVSILNEVPISLKTTTNVTIIPFGWNEETTELTQNTENNTGIQNLLQKTNTTTIVVTLVIIAAGGTAVVYLIKKRG